MKASLLTIIGFALFIIGFLALLLMLLGLNLTYLKFIDNGGRLLGMLIRISMIILGLIMVYVSRTSTSAREVDEKRD